MRVRRNGQRLTGLPKGVAAEALSPVGGPPVHPVFGAVFGAGRELDVSMKSAGNLLCIDRAELSDAPR